MSRWRVTFFDGEGRRLRSDDYEAYTVHQVILVLVGLTTIPDAENITIVQLTGDLT